MKTKTSIKISMGVCSALLIAACGPTHFDASSSSDKASLGSTAAPVVKSSIAIYDSNNSMVYSDSVSGSSLVLKENQNYNLVLKPTAEISGTSYNLVLSSTSLVTQVTQKISLKSGSNSFSVPVRGDYSLKLDTTAPDALATTKYYTAQVTCANPTFTASSLSPSAISVSASSKAENNLFNLSAAGITSGANGMAPYTCAWDGTGVGIIDTAFGSCDSVVSGFYNNLVGARKVAIVVKDDCNTVVTVSKDVNYPSKAIPLGAGNTFIQGQVSSNGTGDDAQDVRVKGVSYLATNSDGHLIVQPVYSGSTFTISAAQNYGMASSVTYGMTIQLSGLTGSVDYANLSSTLSAASAKIKAIAYTTDQSGDSKGAISFTGSSCTLTNQNVKVQFVAGTPCTTGTASGNQATVEVWGQYSCSLNSASGSSIAITGSFDGMQTIKDSCNGGGGGGGGVTPVNF